MDIIQSIQNSAEGWRSGFSYVASRFTGVKAGAVGAQKPGQPAPAEVSAEDPGTPETVVERIQRSIAESAEGWRMGYAHVVGKARTSIGRSIAGWQMFGTDVSGRVSSTVGGIGKSFGDVAGGVGDWFKNLGEGISSLRWLLYVVVAVILFVAVMSSIGYSGVGGPAARVAEREHARAR